MKIIVSVTSDVLQLGLQGAVAVAVLSRGRGIELIQELAVQAGGLGTLELETASNRR